MARIPRAGIGDHLTPFSVQKTSLGVFPARILQESQREWISAPKEAAHGPNGLVRAGRRCRLGAGAGYLRPAGTHPPGRHLQARRPAAHKPATRTQAPTYGP